MNDRNPPTIMRRPANAVPELTPQDIGYHALPEGIIQTVALMKRRPVPPASLTRDELLEQAAHKVFTRAEGVLFLNGDSIPFEKTDKYIQEFCRNVARDVIETFGL